MFNLNEYMKANRVDILTVKHIVCQDGFTVSAQAGKYNYCEPKKDGAESYTSVELGFPSEYMGDEFIMYCDDIEDPTDTIYSYVPVALVEALVERHGGLKEPCAGS